MNRIRFTADGQFSELDSEHAYRKVLATRGRFSSTIRSALKMRRIIFGLVLNGK
jgi:hypothetical protein